MPRRNDPRLTVARRLALAGALLPLAAAPWLPACSGQNAGTPSSDARAPEAPLPPPARPDDVVLEAHFAHPRETLTQIGQLAGVHLPFELGLSLGLGIDSAVMSSADTHKPMDAVVTGRGDRPELFVVFTPTDGEFRSTLAGRFRLTPVPGLGERLDPRQTTGRPLEGMRCAVVGVPAPIPSRIVCAGSAEALEHAGRYAAFYARGHARDETDALVEVDGPTARTVVMPAVQRALDNLAESMASSAAEERRAHDRPPDYGDPEAVVAMVNTLSRAIPGQAEDIRKLTLRASVERSGITLDTELALAAAGHSALARDAVARAGGPTDHPLASRLPPDSFAALAARAPASDRAAMISDAIDAAVRVLGDRVSDPAAARADLTELFSHAGNALAAGAAREPNNEGVEITALFNLTDGGASARAALARIAHARWLTGLHLGGSAPRPALRGQTLTLQLPASPPAATGARGGSPAARAGGATNAGSETPRETRPPIVAVSVLGDVLVILVGHHVDASLAALGPRAGGPPPAVLATAGAATAVGAFDALAMRGMPDEHAPVTATYGATREGDSVVGRGHVVVPAQALGALRRAIPGRGGPGGLPPRRQAPPPGEGAGD